MRVASQWIRWRLQDKAESTRDHYHRSHVAKYHMERVMLDFQRGSRFFVCFFVLFLLLLLCFMHALKIQREIEGERERMKKKSEIAYQYSPQC